MSAVAKLRCAVYTRKSTDEGLDQEFNSLDAQREACVAFIASQVGLGWKLVPDRYDDGGISGGTMERPALQRLLQDIRDRKVDVVVVYKIDRLTRSLMDFSKIVEIFDASNASFVSVTQQFNTTTSMGRLTLNVLLSFAQFEREVTAERIRDKIAASRRKGMWMGGRVPFGYRIEGKKLLINDQEAGTVRMIFNRYLELKSVPALVRELNRGEGPIAKDAAVPQNDSSATARSAGHYRYGQLYHVLSNPVYIGKARHKGQVHDGEHAALIDVAAFDATQRLLRSLAPDRRSQSSTPDIHLLTGILFDETGDRLTPTSTANHGKRYRYYVSNRLVKTKQRDPSGWRFPAAEIEAAVIQHYRSLISDHPRIAEWATSHRRSERAQEAVEAAAELLRKRFGDGDHHANDRGDLLRQAFPKIRLTSDAIHFETDAAAIIDTLLPACSTTDTPTGGAPGSISESIPITVRRRGNEARIVLPGSTSREPDQNLIDLIVTANRLFAKLTDGSNQGIGDLARSAGLDRSDVGRLLPLAFLAPSIVDDIFAGRQPVPLTARLLARTEEFPNGWQDQRQRLGF
ncbi:recombinase family protein [Mesorhizobium sp. IMUNJ 23232]|uniref:recombinase family protein n=1 Tax=Mesorhizobium sp. IMUNJ 23232 TaxID=3376064 RepID=UPI0037A78ADC